MKAFRSVLFLFLIFSICAFSARDLPAIYFQFDYSYDKVYNDGDGFFFDGSNARATLEAVADFYETNLADTFTAIESIEDGNTMAAEFLAPDTGLEVQIADYNVAADAIVVYVGARDLDGLALAQAGPGGWSASYYDNEEGRAWLDNVYTRGQGDYGLEYEVSGSTAIDFARWGGTITVDPDYSYSWNLDYQSAPGPGQSDLYSTLLHEMAHVLGFGLADSWSNKLVGSTFTGANAKAQYDNNPVPVSGDMGHWDLATDESIVFDGSTLQTAVMEPILPPATRRYVTNLDMAGLEDIGWEVVWPVDPCWTNASGGNYTTGSNWSTGSIPATDANVSFGLSSTYSVTFPATPKTVASVEMTAGTVTWSLGGSTFSMDELSVSGTGTVLVLQNGTLQVAQETTIAAGAFMVVEADGVVDLVESSTFTGSLFVGSGGTLAGLGEIDGNLTNSGLIAPSSGQLLVDGNFIQSAVGELFLQLSGSPVSSTNDSLVVSGLATVDGTLTVELASGYDPAWGEQFNLLSATNVSGQFDSIICDSLADGLVMVISETATDILLDVNLLGDANHSGDVTTADLAAVTGHWQMAVIGGWSEGDFDGDGYVTTADLAAVTGHWQWTAAGGAPNPTTAIPEPSSAIGVVLLLLICGWVRLRRS
jgi:hypothetical protein